MFSTLKNFTTYRDLACRALAAGAICIAVQAWAQEQGQQTTLDRPPADMPPPAVPDDLTQPGAGQPPLTDHPLDVGQNYSADPTEMDDPNANDRAMNDQAIYDDAPPLPPQRPDQYGDDRYDADRIDRAERRSDQPALGIYMLPTEGPGVLITHVYSGTPADIAGLQRGDYLLGIDGQSVDDPMEVRDQILQRRIGDSIELAIWRDGQQQTISATLDPARRVTLDSGAIEDVLPQYVARSFTYYRGPVVRRYGAYYPDTYYYGAPYSYDYGYGYPYSTGYRGYDYGYRPRIGNYYGNPWSYGRRAWGQRYYW